ncbi:A/G-specific adenine glycosylase [Temperatibacter marinus]|uniref:Adenine DNA glycosylase n=1 Tax=Temperatibacter marinus TaxID=1456591 RepID=A0AA52H9S3_9PROT|nr:A/G-specific adenine glycosylase [Temperatibacter marinus]WND01985.1 A/G-specific adenine glycosylase [Temperatibacter marinus]
MTSITKKLLAWYDQEKRTLPWRAEPPTTQDPYKVWMSEIMLQQTTVATVKGYFDKFLKRWPTVMDLASAVQEDVLAEWAGLGYYARARNLHKCAQMVAIDYQGQFPTTYQELVKLPGIGDYTAAAIAAIAFGESKAPVVDGNVERFITRLHRIETLLPQAKKEIKAETLSLTPKDRPGDFAQAMMDLGATICSPKKPKCLLCPIQTKCSAFANGDAETFPRKPAKKTKPTRRSLAFILRYEDQILLVRRDDSAMLGGMLGLPHTPWVERDTLPDLGESLTYSPGRGSFIKAGETSKHTFTHFHLITDIYKTSLTNKINIENGEWVRIKDIKTAGLPTVFMKMIKSISD